MTPSELIEMLDMEIELAHRERDYSVLEGQLSIEKRRLRKVLVVGVTGDDVGDNGRVEVYVEGGVAVRCERQVNASQEKNKVIAEQVLEESLPDYWRDVYWPVNLRDGFVCRTLSADAVLNAQATKVAMAAIDMLKGN